MLSQITYFVNVIVTSTALVLVMETGLHQSLRNDWILVQVCSLLLSCCHHVKELLCPQGGLALTISPRWEALLLSYCGDPYRRRSNQTECGT